MAKRDNLGGGSRTAPDSPGSGLDPNSHFEGATQQAKEQAKDLAREAKDETSKMANQAKDQVNQLVSQRKDQAAERLGSFASVLRDTAGKLNEQDENGIGQYADRAADQVERLSNYLRDRDVSTFLRDTETFARRHPDVFLGGVFVAGLVLARFFKASSDRDEWNRDVQSDSGSRFDSRYEPFGGGRYGEGRPYTTERYPGTGTGDALENPRPFEARGV
jgi:hypothetical protein